MNYKELDMRAGDFGWIVSADALRPVVSTVRDVTTALRLEARDALERRAPQPRPAQLTPRASPSQ